MRTPAHTQNALHHTHRHACCTHVVQRSHAPPPLFPAARAARRCRQRAYSAASWAGGGAGGRPCLGSAVHWLRFRGFPTPHPTHAHSITTPHPAPPSPPPSPHSTLPHPTPTPTPPRPGAASCCSTGFTSGRRRQAARSRCVCGGGVRVHSSRLWCADACEGKAAPSGKKQEGWGRAPTFFKVVVCRCLRAGGSARRQEAGGAGARTPLGRPL